MTRRPYTPREQPPPLPSIPKEVIAYLDSLIAIYHGIESIWLFGSRANGTFRTDSDWDFLIFANRAILDALRADDTFRHPTAEIFIVYDGNRFESPWPDDGSKCGRLRNSGDLEREVYVYGYSWNQVSDMEATYISTCLPKCIDRLRACRVYPK
jgi:hypothetical protein